MGWEGNLPGFFYLCWVGGCTTAAFVIWEWGNLGLWDHMRLSDFRALLNKGAHWHSGGGWGHRRLQKEKQPLPWIFVFGSKGTAVMYQSERPTKYLVRSKKAFCSYPDMNWFQHHLETVLHLVSLIIHGKALCFIVCAFLTLIFVELVTSVLAPTADTFWGLHWLGAGFILMPFHHPVAPSKPIDPLGPPALFCEYFWQDLWETLHLQIGKSLNLRSS